MAESEGSSSVMGEMFKAFPVATIILLLIFVYAFWRSTGGVERGIERRVEGKDSIFIQVNSLPGKEGRTFFGNIQVDKQEQENQ